MKIISLYEEAYQTMYSQLELLIRQFQQSTFRHVTLTTSMKQEKKKKKKSLLQTAHERSLHTSTVKPSSQHAFEMAPRQIGYGMLTAQCS